ncbi:MAG TPA: hypothetical protein VGH90_02780 [Chthoniobacteraceae bacterium]|jgi:hypothetical protein
MVGLLTEIATIQPGPIGCKRKGGIAFGERSLRKAHKDRFPKPDEAERNPRAIDKDIFDSRLYFSVISVYSRAAPAKGAGYPLNNCVK